MKVEKVERAPENFSSIDAFEADQDDYLEDEHDPSEQSWLKTFAANRQPFSFRLGNFWRWDEIFPIIVHLARRDVSWNKVSYAHIALSMSNFIPSCFILIMKAADEDINRWWQKNIDN